MKSSEEYAMVERLPMSNSNSIILFDDDKEATTADKNGWMRFERERERRNELTLCVQTTYGVNSLLLSLSFDVWSSLCGGIFVFFSLHYSLIRQQKSV